MVPPLFRGLRPSDPPRRLRALQAELLRHAPAQLVVGLEDRRGKTQASGLFSFGVLGRSPGLGEDFLGCFLGVFLGFSWFGVWVSFWGVQGMSTVCSYSYSTVILLRKK